VTSVNSLDENQNVNDSSIKVLRLFNKKQRAIYQFLIQFVSKIWLSFTPINNINGCNKDKIAKSYMEGHERFRNLVPITNEDDGNCLFN
jgi:hypothetical protein